MYAYLRAYVYIHNTFLVPNSGTILPYNSLPFTLFQLSSIHWVGMGSCCIILAARLSFPPFWRFSFSVLMYAYHSSSVPHCLSALLFNFLFFFHWECKIVFYDNIELYSRSEVVLCHTQLSDPLHLSPYSQCSTVRFCEWKLWLAECEQDECVCVLWKY